MRVDMNVYAQSIHVESERHTVVVRLDNGRTCSAVVERHKTGVVFIGGAGGGGLGAVDARRMIQLAIADSLWSIPALMVGEFEAPIRGHEITIGRTFCQSIARGLINGSLHYPAEYSDDLRGI